MTTKQCRAFRLIAACGMLLGGLVALQPVAASDLSCAQAAALAEVAASLPPGLLLAIGTVESGRADSTGTRAPWPWTINTGGTDYFFASAEAAVQAVESLRARGVESIDVGCFQINLFFHPDAFPTLASGFDPLANALAAVRFLLSLHEEFGAWEPAIAAYHSRAPVEGTLYRDRVLAVWHGGGRPMGIMRASIRGAPRGGIHVWGPAGEIADQGAAAGFLPSRSRLPRIITASGR